MEGNGEFDFWMIYDDFWRIFEDVWRFFEEFWRNWFVVRRRLRTSIKQRTNPDNSPLLELLGLAATKKSPLFITGSIIFTF